MDYYDMNMSCIREVNPELYQKLSDCAEEDIQKQYMEIQSMDCQEARDGGSYLQIRWNGKEIYFNSRYRPLEEARKWCDQFNFDNMGVSVLLFGLGNGIILKEIYSRLYEDAMLYVYEPSLKIFFHALHCVDMREFITCPSIIFFVEGINENVFSSVLQRYMIDSSLAVQVVCMHPKYKEVFGNEAVYFLEQIKRTMERIKLNSNTGVYFANLISKNVFKNLHYIMDGNSCAELVGKLPTDVPAIIIAAGPSLDKNIRELKKAEGKAFLFATDTAVRWLLKENIQFDAMITVDPEKPDDYIQDERCREIPLFCDVSSNPNILNFHTGKKIWMQPGIIVGSIYKDYDKPMITHATGGSVATSAFYIAKCLGFQRIVLVGQDLAYQGETSHAGGDNTEIADKSEVWVEGIDGQKIRSRGDWDHYRGWYEESIRILSNLDVIDATEGGALIHGTRLLPLKEVIETYCNKKVEITKMIQEFPPTFSGLEREQVREDLLHLPQEFEETKTLVEETMELCEHLIEELTQTGSGSQSDFALVSEKNAQILKKRVYSVIESYIEGIATEVTGKLFVITGDPKEDQLATLRYAKIIYEAYLKGIQELSDDLKKAVEKIE